MHITHEGVSIPGQYRRSSVQILGRSESWEGSGSQEAFHQPNYTPVITPSCQ